MKLRNRIAAGIITTMMMLTMIPINSFAAVSVAEKESNNTFRTANTISLESGAIITGTYSSDQDYDFFKFTTSSTEKVTFLLSNINGSSGGIVDIYDEDYQELDGYSFYHDDKTIRYFTPGTYYLRLLNCASEGGEKYELKIKEVVSGIETLTEPNNNFGTANVLELNKKYDGVTWDRDRSDYVKIDLPAGTYNLNVVTKTTSTEGSGVFVTPYNDDYEEIDFYEDANKINHIGKTMNKEFKWKGGVLYIEFYSTIYDDVEYSVMITKKVVTPVKVSKPSITKLSKAKKAFTAKWTKNAGSGYELRYSTKSSMKSAKTIKISGSSNVSKKVSKLKKNKKYYVQVRTVRTESGKNYYSDWSAKKSVKTK